MGINVSKYGIMHMRKKGIVRSKMSYSIGDEDLPFISNYKYLGCTVNEHLDLDDMVKDKGVDGKKALGAWFQRCNGGWGCRSRNIQEVKEFNSGVHHDVRSRGLGV